MAGVLDGNDDFLEKNKRPEYCARNKVPYVDTPAGLVKMQMSAEDAANIGDVCFASWASEPQRNPFQPMC